MNGRKIFLSIYGLELIVAVTLGVGLAQEPGERDGLRCPLEVEGVVSSKFQYQ